MKKAINHIIKARIILEKIADDYIDDEDYLSGQMVSNIIESIIAVEKTTIRTDNILI